MKIKCQKCAKQWDYKGESIVYATCPQCLTKVKVAQ